MKKIADFSTKPYNRCLLCEHRIQHHCDGARTSAMTLPRWCEFMRDMKDVNGMTNADIAEKSGVSIKTIEKLMAQNCEQDVMRETARLIEDAIIGSSNQYPCYLAFEESAPEERGKYREALENLERALADNEGYKKTLESINSSYNEELKILRIEEKAKNDHLLKQIERLRLEVDYLRIENDRKAKIIDKYLQ